MRSVVVGYDGSESGREAVALATLLTRALGGRVVVVVVDEIHLLTGPAPGDEEHERALRATRDEGVSAASGVEAEGRVIWGSVPECLEVIATDVGADLIVVGSTHRGAIGRVAPGSVGDRLLAGAPCAVAVAPRGFASGDVGVRRVGVGFNGEAESWAALRLADGIAGALRASLTVIGAVPVVPRIGSRVSHTEAGYERVVSSWLAERIGEAADACSSGAAVTEALEHGDPAEILVGSSEDLDLLVLGSRGYGPVGRVLLGGVASRVITGAACPVIVTPRSAAEGRVGR